MTMSTKPVAVSIVVKFSFEGFHHWPEAPGNHSYLRYPHRHVFHVVAAKRVNHNNRDIEFIVLKRELHRYACSYFGGSPTNCHSLSCEEMAERLLNTFDLSSCSVLEDDENGAFVTSLEEPSPAPLQVEAEETSKPEPEPEPEIVFNHTKRRFVGVPFYGQECEGPTKEVESSTSGGEMCIWGFPTIFIPGDVPFCRLLEQDFYAQYDFSNVGLYLGADNCPISNPEWVSYAAELIRKRQIRHVVLEVPSLSSCSYEVRLQILTSQVNLNNAGFSKKFLVVTKDVGDSLPDKTAPFLINYIKVETHDHIIWIRIQKPRELSRPTSRPHAYMFATRKNNPAFDRDVVLSEADFSSDMLADDDDCENEDC